MVLNQKQGILAISRQMIAAQEESEVMQCLVDGLSKLVEYDTMAVYVVEEKEMQLRPVILHGPVFVKPNLSKWTIDKGVGIVGDVFLKGEPELVNNAHLDKRAFYPEGIKLEHEQLMIFPLKQGEKSWGVFLINRISQQEFSNDEFQMAEFLASYASLALNNTSLIQKMIEKDRKQMLILHAIPDIIFRIKKGKNDFELIGRNGDPSAIQLIIDEENMAIYKSHFYQVIQTKEAMEFEYTMTLGESPCYYEVRLAYIDEDECLAVVRDLTLRKKNEQDLLHAKLEAEHLMNAKQDFLARMSHELRTPINGVLGLSNLMLNADLSKENREYLRGIRSSGEHLLAIINDILDLAKIEAGKLELMEKPFSVYQLVDAVIESQKPMAEQKGIHLSATVFSEIPDIIVSDPIRVKQILLNLLSNAVKFTDKGFVTLTCNLNAGHRLEFIVHDSGIGIPKEMLGPIFESFTQADEKTSVKYGGTGLGLSIVKELTELLSGTVRVESEIGKGSVFVICIPFKNPTEHQVPEQALESDNPFDQKKSFPHSHILVAEDNLINQLVVKNTLEQWGVQVTIAENGLIAIEKLKQEKFDLIIMDVQMPEMDGMEATHRIRSEFSAPVCDIPILAMTASVLYDPEGRVKSAGMNDYLPKPFKVEELYAKLAKYLDNDGELIPQQRVERIAGKGYLDLTYLKSLVPDNPDFISEMLLLFRRQAVDFLRKAKQQLLEKNYTALEKTAHTFKPQGAYLGVDSLKDLVGALEKTARKPAEADRIEGLITQSEILIDAILNEIKDFIKPAI